MSDTKDLLCEIGCEELPAKYLGKLAITFYEKIIDELNAANLNFQDIKYFATPRRLAIQVNGLVTQQKDTEIERRGPNLTAAYDKNNKPTPAAEGFARSCGVNVDQLTMIEDGKGKWLAYRQLQKGQTTKDLIPNIIRQAIKKLPIPKPMRWGNSDIEFIRPVHWVVLLFGDEVIEAEIFGKKTDRYTNGHRFHCLKPIELKNPNDYEKALEKGYAIVDPEKRRDRIKAQIEKIDSTIDLDKQLGLLNEVNNLVEWPVALRVNFDQDFLELPPEVLIAAMRDHQKSFYVGFFPNLSSHFITVSNIESKKPEEVIKGNERVMRARLADAKFFYETDLNHSLESYLPRLANVTYQAKLGSLKDKSDRLMQLCEYLAQQLKVDVELAKRAGQLAKCDLMTGMVGEFPELQGIMGFYYAQNDGEKPEVALALRDQYLPHSAEVILKLQDLSSILAIADRIDTLVGFFAVGNVPTGEKDPYALRRAAWEIVRIIYGNNIDLDLLDLLHQTQSAYKDYPGISIDASILQEVKDFIFDRILGWNKDRKQKGLEEIIRPDIFQAVIVRQSSNINDFFDRCQALASFRNLPAAESLIAANKRVSNILKKEDLTKIPKEINEKLLEQVEEKQLFKFMMEAKQKIEPLCNQKNYTKALEELAKLQTPINVFFDKVMVMVEDKKIRENRLALLSTLRNLFLHIADISLLQ